ncbi:MAG TPA: TonB family protein [Acidobacteriota bacterium]|nr:TonB family protein [Acidobacteriota bacterium]
MFDQLLESSCARKKNSGGRGFWFSLLAHGIVIGLVLALPMIFYQALPGSQLLAFMAPPPRVQPLPVPPPPAPSSPQSQPVERAVILADAFVAPTVVPEEIPPPDEALPTPMELWADGSGQRSALPDGVRGASVGIPSGLTRVSPSTVPPPPPPPRPKNLEPERVGGDVLASRLIRRVDPVYPDLARRIGLQGKVLIKVIVDEEGKVTQAEVVDGHKFLAEPALEAVLQWRYSPTILNGQPVPVVGTISVRFRLNR